MNSVFSRLGFWLLMLALLCTVRAQSGATGAITGRVFNPANGEYLRNAEVRIEGTALVVISEEGGYYRITNAPAGDVNVIASYIGHEPATARVTVTAGAAATH